MRGRVAENLVYLASQIKIDAVNKKLRRCKLYFGYLLPLYLLHYAMGYKPLLPLDSINFIESLKVSKFRRPR